MSPKTVVAHVQTRQHPDGRYGRMDSAQQYMDVWMVQVLAKGVTDTDGDVIPLTCTQGEQLRGVWHPQL